MTVCNDCGDTLVPVLYRDGEPELYVCPDCFFAALTIRHRLGVNPSGDTLGGTGRESGVPQVAGQGSGTPNRSESGTTAARFLCPSCRQTKPWPFDKVVVPVSEDGLLLPRTYVVCNDCWQEART